MARPFPLAGVFNWILEILLFHSLTCVWSLLQRWKKIKVGEVDSPLLFLLSISETICPCVHLSIVERSSGNHCKPFIINASRFCPNWHPSTACLCVDDLPFTFSNFTHKQSSHLVSFSYSLVTLLFCPSASPCHSPRLATSRHKHLRPKTVILMTR